MILDPVLVENKKEDQQEHASAGDHGLSFKFGLPD